MFDFLRIKVTSYLLKIRVSTLYEIIVTCGNLNRERVLACKHKYWHPDLALKEERRERQVLWVASGWQHKTKTLKVKIKFKLSFPFKFPK